MDEEEVAHWRGLRRERPERVEVPGPGRESVWDYPRPPRVEAVSAPLRVEFAGVVVAETRRGLRVVETSSPPAYYFPPEDVKTAFLRPMRHAAFCEWKGEASYWTLSARGRESEAAAWSYASPNAGYEALAGWFAFHAGRADACYVGDERAAPQPGGYYGGWITSAVAGPFKGEPGTERW